MTSALVCFHKNHAFQKSIYYNSDGYQSYLGKLVADFLHAFISTTKKHDFVSFEHMFGSYVLNDNYDGHTELSDNNPSKVELHDDYAYIINWSTLLNEVTNYKYKAP